uniref:Uncharacterized protein n=1 Tax=viral metagenome TaxID=1070528 RepID=A0A6H1ZJZ8_9ZZZZ
MPEETKFEEWCIVELFGFTKLGAKVTEATLAGAPFIRLDIPRREGGYFTKFQSPQSIYGITPVSEEVARAFALNHEPQPVNKYELQMTDNILPWGGGDDAGTE